jgi:hypothetical protein
VKRNDWRAWALPLVFHSMTAKKRPQSLGSARGTSSDARSPSSALNTRGQGLTLVHGRAQLQQLQDAHELSLVIRWTEGIKLS